MHPSAGEQEKKSYAEGWGENVNVYKDTILEIWRVLIKLFFNNYLCTVLLQMQKYLTQILKLFPNGTLPFIIIFSPAFSKCCVSWVIVAKKV